MNNGLENTDDQLDLDRHQVCIGKKDPAVCGNRGIGGKESTGCYEYNTANCYVVSLSKMHSKPRLNHSVSITHYRVRLLL